MKHITEHPKEITLRDGKNEMQFRIVRLDGTGSTSVSYIAEMQLGDSRPLVRLKAFCPTYLKEGTTQYDEAKKHFIKAYQIQLGLLSDTLTVDATSPSKMMFDGDTPWLVTPYAGGTTLASKNDWDSLEELIQTLQYLGEAVKTYHSMGFLLCDLKPENVYLYNGIVRDGVQLFDFDSLIDLKSKMPTLSSTTGWMAPEVATYALDKISVGSDYYSFGQIVFYILFGRHATAQEERVGAVYDFSQIREPFRAGIKVEIGKRLKNFLQKTIVKAPSARFADDNELLAALEEILHLCRLCYDFYSNILPKPGIATYVDPSNQLRKIEQAFQKGHIVIIQGTVSGCGKTQLALRYAQLQSCDYDAIEFCVYDESRGWDGVIEACGFSGRDSRQSRAKYGRELLSKTPERILLIVDNFSGRANQEFPSLGNNVDVLLTTRYETAAFPGAEYVCLTPEKELSMKIFKRVYCGNEKRKLGSEQEKLGETILEKTGFHPYLADLIAQVLAEMYPSTEGFKQYLRFVKEKELLVRDKGIKVRSRKDKKVGDSAEAKTIGAFVELLFEDLFEIYLNRLDTSEREITNLILYLFTRQRIWDRDLILQFLGDDKESIDFDAFNALKRLQSHHWVTEQQNDSSMTIVSVHPLLFGILQTKPEYLYSRQKSLHFLGNTLLCETFTRPDMYPNDFFHILRTVCDFDILLDDMDDCRKELSLRLKFLLCNIMERGDLFVSAVLFPREAQVYKDYGNMYEGNWWLAAAHQERKEAVFFVYFPSGGQYIPLLKIQRKYSLAEENITEANFDTGDSAAILSCYDYVSLLCAKEPWQLVPAAGPLSWTEDEQLKQEDYQIWEPMQNICLSDTLLGLPLEEIGWMAFSNWHDIQRITLPKHIKRINYGAFCNCNSLVQINIPEGVDSIESYTFDNCGSLRHVDFPQSLTCIKRDAFVSCGSLTFVRIPGGVCVHSGAFSYCSQLNEVEIGLEATICDSAFANCQNIRKVIFPVSAKLASGSFLGCPNIIELECSDDENENELIRCLLDLGASCKEVLMAHSKNCRAKLMSDIYMNAKRMLTNTETDSTERIQKAKNWLLDHFPSF